MSYIANATEEKWELCGFRNNEGNEYEGLFSDLRIDRSSVPEGWYCYEIRHDDEDQGYWAEIGTSVMVNFWGTLLTTEQLLAPGQKFCEVADYGYMHCYVSLSDVVRLAVRFFTSGTERYCVVSDCFGRFGCFFFSTGAYGECVYIPGTEEFLPMLDEAIAENSQEKIDRAMGKIAISDEGGSESGADVIFAYFKEYVPACMQHLKEQILEYLDPSNSSSEMKVIYETIWEGGSDGV